MILQLASTDRQRILAELRESDLRLNEIAKVVEMTPTETIRQVHRLTDARLLEKTTDGRFRLTPYGKLVLDVTSVLGFLTRHRDYFMTHDGFLLPTGFRRRLEELSGTSYAADTIETINKATEIVQDAEKQIDAVILGTVGLLELMHQRSDAGVKVRWLIHESFLPKAPAILRTWEHRPESRTAAAVPGHLLYNEKTALVTLRRLDGSMGYASFSGGDSRFREWAKGLFLYQWERARPWKF